MSATIANPVSEVVTEPDGTTTEKFPLPCSETSLLRLFTILFEEHAHEITFGPCLQGAVFEIHVDKPGKLTMLDGYLTVDFGSWHFHLCIGTTRGTTSRPCPEELARQRRAERAELFRSTGGTCVPASWGLRVFNGAGDQMITVFLPNPYLSDDDHRLRRPDWSRLALWDRLRSEFLGLGPDPRDREER